MTHDPQPRNIPLKPAGHVWLPAAMIGSLSMLLAGGLEWLGWLGPLNLAIARAVSGADPPSFPQQMPVWAPWLAAALLAFGLAAAILATSGHGRRIILWLSAMVVVAGWAPVLSLAAHAPQIGAPAVATLWSGVCALVYAANHRMPCDTRPRPAAIVRTATDDPC